MNILITGNLGKVGQAVEESLLLAGHRVKGLSRATGVDITDQVRVEAAIVASKPEVVIHLAAVSHPIHQMPSSITQMFNTNVAGTFNVLEACVKAGTRRFVYMSSTGYYGLISGCWLKSPVFPLTETSPCGREGTRGVLDSYCQSKVMAEELCAYYGRRQMLDVVVLRSPPIRDRVEAFVEGMDWTDYNPTSYQWNVLFSINPLVNCVKAIKLCVICPTRFGYEVFNVANSWLPACVDSLMYLKTRFGSSYTDHRVYKDQALISSQKISSYLGFVAEDEKAQVKACQ